MESAKLSSQAYIFINFTHVNTSFIIRTLVSVIFTACFLYLVMNLDRINCGKIQLILSSLLIANQCNGLYLIRNEKHKGADTNKGCPADQVIAVDHCEC